MNIWLSRGNGSSAPAGGSQAWRGLRIDSQGRGLFQPCVSLHQSLETTIFEEKNEKDFSRKFNNSFCECECARNKVFPPRPGSDGVAAVGSCDVMIQLTQVQLGRLVPVTHSSSRGAARSSCHSHSGQGTKHRTTTASSQAIH